MLSPFFADADRIPDCAFTPMTITEARKMQKHLDPIIRIQGGKAYFVDKSPLEIAYQVAIAGSKDGARLADILQAIGR
jgi:hypothetical protein